MKLTTKLLAGAAFALAAMASTANAADMKIALLVKSLGNGFFEAANKGAEEAAKELGGVEIIYTGPTTTTAEGQIEVINSLIAQGVDAIAISANDPDAVVPALKKAFFDHKDDLVFLDIHTAREANVFPMVAAGKGLSEMVLADENL